MVQQLRKRERDAWRSEQYGRQMFALDRENQADPKERERAVNYRTLDAKWKAAHPEQPRPVAMPRDIAQTEAAFSAQVDEAMG